MPHAIFVLNVLSTAAMTGLIWFVQVVHYPLFARVGAAEFVRYEGAHTSLTGFVVIPFMLLELATACALLWVRPEGFPLWAAWLGLGLVGLVWGSTFLLQVPQHEVLAGGFSANAHRLLVTTNWIRTAGWSARTILLGWFLWKMLDAR
jgi:hypothetical protein